MHRTSVYEVIITVAGIDFEATRKRNDYLDKEGTLKLIEELDRLNISYKIAERHVQKLRNGAVTFPLFRYLTKESFKDQK